MLRDSSGQRTIQTIEERNAKTHLKKVTIRIHYTVHIDTTVNNVLKRNSKSDVGIRIEARFMAQA